MTMSSDMEVQEQVQQEQKPCKLRLLNLPTEVLCRIIQLCDGGDAFALLLSCKELCELTGPIMYRNLSRDIEWKSGHKTDIDTNTKDASNSTESMDRKQRKCKSIFDLFKGLEHRESTVGNPFGRELKLRFIKKIDHLHWDMALFYNPRETPERDTFFTALKLSRQDHLILFPKLESLVLHEPTLRKGNDNDPKSVIPSPFDRHLRAVKAICDLSNPLRVCRHNQPFYFVDDMRNVTVQPLVFGQPPKVDLARQRPSQIEIEAEIADTISDSTTASASHPWIPKVFIQHLKGTPSGLGICYGTTNRIVFVIANRTREVARPNIDFFLFLLKAAHPELVGPAHITTDGLKGDIQHVHVDTTRNESIPSKTTALAKGFTQEDIAIRNQTTWEFFYSYRQFSFNGRPPSLSQVEDINEHIKEVNTKLLQKIMEELPGLRDRVTVSELPESMVCESCGADVVKSIET